MCVLRDCKLVSTTDILSFAFFFQSPYYDIPPFQAAGRDGLSTTFHGKLTYLTKQVPLDKWFCLAVCGTEAHERVASLP